MYEYGMYEMEEATSGIFAGILAGMGTSLLICGIIGLVMIIAMWKLFSKAGRPGWAAIIPIYNVIVMLDIAGYDWWYMLLLLIPIVNIVVLFKVYIGIAENFGKSTGFGVAMVFFSVICMPMLAFGSAEYIGK